jgi:hypothetical protein
MQGPPGLLCVYEPSSAALGGHRCREGLPGEGLWQVRGIEHTDLWVSGVHFRALERLGVYTRPTVMRTAAAWRQALRRAGSG